MRIVERVRATTTERTGVRSSRSLVVLLGHEWRARLSGALLLCSGTGESCSFGLGVGALLLLTVLAAQECEGTNANDNGGSEDDGDDNTSYVEVVLEVHADIRAA